MELPLDHIATSAAAPSPVPNRVSGRLLRDFEELVRAYEVPVYQHIRCMVGNADDARDLTQDTFLKLLRALPKPGLSLTPALLYRIATNVCLDALRQRRRAVCQSLDALGATERGDATGWEAGWRVSGNASLRWLSSAPAEITPEEAILRNECRDRVWTTLDGLPAQHRTALILRGYYDLSCPETGRALGLSLAATKSLLVRARAAFRTAWQRAQLDANTRSAAN